MASEEDRRAARGPRGTATTGVGGAPGRDARWFPLRCLARGRWSRRPVWDEERDTRWRDTMLANRPGWRERAAYLDGGEVFAVDYQVCRGCGLGWVEEPYTVPDYQRCGSLRQGSRHCAPRRITELAGGVPGMFSLPVSRARCQPNQVTTHGPTVPMRYSGEKVLEFREHVVSSVSNWPSTLSRRPQGPAGSAFLLGDSCGHAQCHWMPGGKRALEVGQQFPEC